MNSFRKALSVLLALCTALLPLFLTSCLFTELTEPETQIETVSVVYDDTETQTRETQITQTSAASTTRYTYTTEKPATTRSTTEKKRGIDENGSYYSRDDVALYVHTYHHLPPNYITKKDARALGWNGGSVDPYFQGGAIGGDYYGNYEGKLPDGKKYYECDIDTLGKSKRGAKRLIYSPDGTVYYTDDHYNSFTQLY
jgi:guanyl-specific ribonuclease Sa